MAGERFFKNVFKLLPLSPFSTTSFTTSGGKIIEAQPTNQACPIDENHYIVDNGGSASFTVKDQSSGRKTAITAKDIRGQGVEIHIAGDGTQFVNNVDLPEPVLGVPGLEAEYLGNKKLENCL